MSQCGRKRKRGEKHPYLSGNFAPVNKTLSPTPCTYTGVIPSELTGGEYVRNGGNPVSNEDLGRDAHWFDGDGMLAGVIFEKSTLNPLETVPRFVNQYILTDLCMSSHEQHSSRTPILPSIATLVNPVARFLVIVLSILRSVFLVILSHLPGSQHAIKRISVANTSILFHDGRALATCESGPPIRVQLPGLETVGWFDGHRAEGEKTPPSKEAGLGGTGLLSFTKEWTTGHPKVDPQTGEMILFHCNFVAPFVHYSVIPATESQSAKDTLSKLLNLPVPGVSGGKMMHDFGVSQHHIVIMDLPLKLDPFNLIKNQPVVSYDEDQPSRFGVFPRRDPSKVQWFETKCCCIFHTANTWDEFDASGNMTAVNMLACRLTSATLVFAAGNLPAPSRPRRKQSTAQKPMSFFAKYDYDQVVGDTARSMTPAHEDDMDFDLEKVQYSENDFLLPTAVDDFDEAEEEQCRLYHYRFSLADPTPTITSQYALSTIPFEFPTVNPAYEMSAARYIYGCSTSTTSFGAALGKATKIDVLVKADVHTLISHGQTNPPANITGSVDTRSTAEILKSHDPNDPIRAFEMPPHWYAQEARFVSRANPVSEDDGFLLFYAFDESQLDESGECTPSAISELWIIDAKNMKEVIARVQLPQRVPYGLHGNWFSAGMIRDQREVERFRTMPVESEGKGVWRGLRKRLIQAVG